MDKGAFNGIEMYESCPQKAKHSLESARTVKQVWLFGLSLYLDFQFVNDFDSLL
jgi:hypothetical protein